MLTEEQKRFLTVEVLKEEWDSYVIKEWPYYDSKGYLFFSVIPIDGQSPVERTITPKRRTFGPGDWPDFGALINAVKGWQDAQEFFNWAILVNYEDCDGDEHSIASYNNIDPERFALLVWEWRNK